LWNSWKERIHHRAAGSSLAPILLGISDAINPLGFAVGQDFFPPSPHARFAPLLGEHLHSLQEGAQPPVEFSYHEVLARELTVL